ncbi:MAG: hypothetical protein ABSF59_24180 [Candidatus Sulfotelmatobacter sp.]|jgi:hypothetical protein
MLAEGGFCGEMAGVCLLGWRNFICGVMIVLVPASLTAQDNAQAFPGNGRAMLHSNGGTWLNERPAPASAAIFMEALIQTQKDHSARIDADGSTATIGPDTLVQFEGDELVLDHGSVQVSTVRKVRVRVNCVTVIPMTEDRTYYEVTDVDGKVRVVAYKKDVKVHAKGAVTRLSKKDTSTEAIVREGEQSTRSEKCGGAIKPVAAIDGKIAVLDTNAAKVVGGVGIGVIIICAIWCRGDDPISPSTP